MRRSKSPSSRGRVCVLRSYCRAYSTSFVTRRDCDGSHVYSDGILCTSEHSILRHESETESIDESVWRTASELTHQIPVLVGQKSTDPAYEPLDGLLNTCEPLHTTAASLDVLHQRTERAKLIPTLAMRAPIDLRPIFGAVARRCEVLIEGVERAERVVAEVTLECLAIPRRARRNVRRTRDVRPARLASGDHAARVGDCVPDVVVDDVFIDDGAIDA